MLGDFSTAIRAGAVPWSSDAEVARAFEQSPKCTLLVDASSLRTVGFNDALQRELGFSREELQNLSLTDLFEGESAPEALSQQLRNPDPRVPVRARQRAKDGKWLEVEITGYRVNAGERQLLVFTTQDITLRRRFEARMREKQGRL